jgi:VPDSG-CTERM motif
MKILRYFIMCAVVSCASVAYADSFTFSTPAGATVGGQPVNATASFDTEDGFVSIVIANNQPNPKSIIQAISDLSFNLSNVTSGTLGLHNFSQERTIAADGTFTDGNVVDPGWALSNVGSTFHLNVLGTPTAPAHLIIGGPGLGSVYSNANASIAGNGPHNPFLGLSAVFQIVDPGITADTQVSNVVFSFGTFNIPDSGATVALLGLALIGLAVARAKFRKA